MSEKRCSECGGGDGVGSRGEHYGHSQTRTLTESNSVVEIEFKKNGLVGIELQSVRKPSHADVARPTGYSARKCRCSGISFDISLGIYSVHARIGEGNLDAHFTRLRVLVDRVQVDWRIPSARI